MHKLDRTAAQSPDCLVGYDYQTQNWDDLGRECKQALRAALLQMQGWPGVTTADANEYGLRCAYCEGAVHHRGHIEHFRRKNPEHYPELTFVWENLFLACGSNDHCGHYKDRKGAAPYDPDQLIKPDDQDPEHFLYFHSSGQVRPRSGLDAAGNRRVEETIRVFGLNSPVLSGARSKVLTTYKQRVLADIEVLLAWPDTERVEYLTQEIEATRWEPYATTIKHFLQSYS